MTAIKLRMSSEELEARWTDGFAEEDLGSADMKT
jgi:hypothetical protein